MPHIHLETTADLQENGEIPQILERLIIALSSVESISTTSIKAYHTLRTNWMVGEGHPEGFAHCTLGVLSGRSPELRAKLADTVFAELKRCFEFSDQEGGVAVTLEVRDMDALTYRR